jgi:hypothetical protein
MLGRKCADTGESLGRRTDDDATAPPQAVSANLVEPRECAAFVVALLERATGLALALFTIAIGAQDPSFNRPGSSLLPQPPPP